MNKVLIIPGTYKSTLTSCLAADIITQQYKELRPYDSVKQVCISDGGEGTLDVFLRNFGGKTRFYLVHGMRGELIAANTLWLDDTTVIIESASIVGYSLISDLDRNPWALSSYGIGELLLLAKKDGAKEIYVTMGDSSIMDVGVGMLRALGVEFFGEENHLLEMTDLSSLEKIRSINLEKMASFSNIKVFALVDTKDYLFGEFGQTNVYGAQKGLRQEQAENVERGFKNYARVIYAVFGIDLSNIPMTTGSGGLAASLSVFLDAELIHCPLYIAEKINLKNSISEANILITGEGILDNQTRWGKIPYFVSQGFLGTIFLLVGNCSKVGVDDIRRVSQASLRVIQLEHDVPPIKAIANATAKVCNEINKIGDTPQLPMAHG